MKTHRWAAWLVTAGLAVALLWAPLALADAKSVAGFPELERRSVTFWSDGTRLAGDPTYPKDIEEGEKLPAIVLCHGWGGVKAHLNFQIAPRFAAEGYVVFAFDYRGWGESDSRLVVEGEMPEPDADGFVNVKARAIRELVDPLDQQEDIDAAITFVEGEPMVDKERIGIWGSSFGGGHVIWRAAHDDRVKCVVAQVGAMDQRFAVAEDPGLEALHADKIKRVRGELPPVPIGADKPEGLRGDPYYERFAVFVPVDFAHLVDAPTLIIDAELEHYFDNKEHGGKVAKIMKETGKAPVEYHELEGKEHYDVYTGETLDEVMKLEIAWYNEHLKGDD